MRVAVIGAGIGGLAAAIRLAGRGHEVILFEARDVTGGLASPLVAGGEQFDGGPYILLDRPGLHWALDELGLERDAIALRRVENLYEVSDGEKPPVRVTLDLEETAAALEARWSGAGPKYLRFVGEMEALRQKLAPLLRVSRPGLVELARAGAVGAVPFLLRSLASVLARAGLPAEVVDAIAIWTHVAGQPLRHSPSVMAFVPALIHHEGAFYPQGGLSAIPQFLTMAAQERGVDIRCSQRVTRIRTSSARVVAVETESEVIPCDRVISNYHGVGTYDELLDEVPAGVRREVRKIPLQSPGLCVYLLARGRSRGPYLRFRKRGGRVMLLVSPAVAEGTTRERFPLRLIMPLGHGEAMSRGEAGQQELIDAMVAEAWWKEGLEEHEIVACRTVRGWGREMHLYRDSMNPAMTRAMMLRGRMPHRSRSIGGLYLTGASTHPGQWVSFCAMSGVIAADQLHEDR